MKRDEHVHERYTLKAVYDKYSVRAVNGGRCSVSDRYAALRTALNKAIAELNYPHNSSSEFETATQELLRETRGLTDLIEILAEREADKARIAELEARKLTAAAKDVLAERLRQMSEEGWTPERDDTYHDSELADAAACYALHAHNQGFPTPAHWPWDRAWWKQTNPRRDLVKAGALILAEIERIDRAAGITLETGELG